MKEENKEQPSTCLPHDSFLPPNRRQLRRLLAVAVQKLHTALIYVQALRKEVETADHTISAANEDLGLASSDCDTRDELTGEVWAGFRRSL
jgi:hypothetical protein